MSKKNAKFGGFNFLNRSLDGTPRFGGGEGSRHAVKAFGTIPIRRSERPLNMSRKSATRMWIMIVGLLGAILFILLDVPGLWFQTSEALQEGEQRYREALARPDAADAESARPGNPGPDLFYDEEPWDPDMEAPTALQHDGDADGEVPQTQTDDPEPGSPDPLPDPEGTPPPPLPGDPTEDDLLSEHLPPRPRPIPERLRHNLPVRHEDAYNDRSTRFGELHAWLLQTAHELTPEEWTEFAYTAVDPMWGPLVSNAPGIAPPDPEGDAASLATFDPWFETRISDLHSYIGRAFTMEGGLFLLRKVDASAFNLEAGVGAGNLLINGKPVEEVWEGIVSFQYNRYETRPNGTHGYVRRYANVYFTALDLPESLKNTEFYDDEGVFRGQRMPPRVRVSGLMFRLRPYITAATNAVPQPHLVAGPVTEVESPPVTIDHDLLATIDDSTDAGRIEFPKPAIHNLLAVLRQMTPDERAEWEDSYDRDIGYMDVFYNPQVYRQEPVVLRFYGQVRAIGDEITEEEREPFMHWTDRAPNPYGINEQYFGAMVTLDEHGRQQLVTYDCLELALTCPECGWEYPPMDDNTREIICPECGHRITKRDFEKGDEIMVTGFFLWKWRYQDHNDKWRDAPRLVASKVTLLPPREDPLKDYKWVVVVIIAGMLILIFFLLNRERSEERSFRHEFLKRQVDRLDGKGKSISARTAPRGAEGGSAEAGYHPPGTPFTG